MTHAFHLALHKQNLKLSASPWGLGYRISSKVLLAGPITDVECMNNHDCFDGQSMMFWVKMHPVDCDIPIIHWAAFFGRSIVVVFTGDQRLAISYVSINGYFNHSYSGLIGDAWHFIVIAFKWDLTKGIESVLTLNGTEVNYNNHDGHPLVREDFGLNEDGLTIGGSNNQSCTGSNGVIIDEITLMQGMINAEDARKILKYYTMELSNND